MRRVFYSLGIIEPRTFICIPSRNINSNELFYCSDWCFTCVWMHVRTSHRHIQDFVLSRRGRKKSIDRLPWRCCLVLLFRNRNFASTVFFPMNICWGVVMMRMYKEFDFVNECDRDNRRKCSFPFMEFVNNIHIPRMIVYTYFIDRFYRTTFPIQINSIQSLQHYSKGYGIFFTAYFYSCWNSLEWFHP